MPITTRAGALRSKGDGTAGTILHKPISKHPHHKRARQCQPKRREEKVKVSTPAITCETATRPSVDQQASVPQLDPRSQVDNTSERASKKSDEDMDMSLESLFSDPESKQSADIEAKVIEEEINTSARVEPLDHLATSSSLLDALQPPLAAEELPAIVEVAKENDLPSSPPQSNESEAVTFIDISDEITNRPVVKGEITTGTSTRGGKMIFMNQYGYLYMNETKTTIGWRCVKRNENCKAVIYTLKISGEFSHWSGKCHCHLVDLSDTRKREISANIKSRVLDEFVSIQSIVEDEYRKANLSVEEKKMMPLPCQIGTSISALFDRFHLNFRIFSLLRVWPSQAASKGLTRDSKGSEICHSRRISADVC